MAKFIFIFVLALFVLQGSDATQLTNQLDLFKEGNEVKDLINEINKVLTNVSTSESKLRKQLNDKFSELESAANIPSLVTELQQNITQILADGGNATDSCNTDAWEGFEEVTKLTSVEHCKTKIVDETANLKKLIQKYVSQVRYILTEISAEVDYCARTNWNDYKSYKACVEREVVKAKVKLFVKQQAIQEIFNILDAYVPMYTNIMSKCVNGKKQEIVNKMTDLIKDVQLCIKSNSDHAFIFA